MEAEAHSLKTRNGGPRKACEPRSPPRVLLSFKSVTETWPLPTEAEWNIGDRVLSEGEKNSFTTLLDKGGQQLASA